jgi:pimeloyl-ACP methyl ester carboxylesterase
MKKLKDIFEDFQESHPLNRLEVGDLSWEYLKGGQGEKTILVLPGGGSVAEATFPYMLELEKEFKVIAVNLPDKIKTVEECMQGLKAILKKEKVEKMAILGFSMGGMLGQVLLREEPENIEELVLFVSMGPSKKYSKSYKRKSWLMETMPASWVKFLSKIFLKKQIHAETVAASQDEKKFWTGFFNWTFDSGKMNKSKLISSGKVLNDYFENYQFMAADLKKWAGRILIFEAEKDRIVDEEARLGLRGIYPQAKLIELKESGHFGKGLFQNEEIIGQIKNFFQGK